MILPIRGPFPDGTFDVIVGEVREPIDRMAVDLIVVVDQTGRVVEKGGTLTR